MPELTRRIINVSDGTISDTSTDAVTGRQLYSAITTADTAVTAAGSAQTTANTAVTAAGAAQTTANTAVTAAGAAQTTANTAVGAAGAAHQRIDALGAQVQQLSVDMNRSGAMSAAASNLSLPAGFTSGASAAIGYQGGQKAIAFGAMAAIAGNAQIRGHVAFSGGRTSVGAGVGWGWR